MDWFTDFVKADATRAPRGKPRTQPTIGSTTRPMPLADNMPPRKPENWLESFAQAVSAPVKTRLMELRMPARALDREAMIEMALNASPLGTGKAAVRGISNPAIDRAAAAELRRTVPRGMPDLKPALDRLGPFPPPPGSILAPQQGPLMRRRLPESWAVLTAEKPGGMPATAAESAARMAEFRKALQERGILHEPVTGAYLDDATKQWLGENSMLLHDVPPDVAEALGRQFGQKSVLTHEGLLDLKAGTLVPSRGIHETAPTDQAYFRLPSGMRMTSDLDWSAPVLRGPLAKP